MVKNKSIKHEIWSKKIALQIAKKEHIVLTPEHWEIIFLIRKCYIKFNVILPTRMLIQIIKKKIGIKQSHNQYLLSLFPKGIMKQANKIAGLPKSNICL